MFPITDHVTLVKPDGTRVEGIPAHVQPRVILVDDASVAVEEGDRILRTLPNKLIESYVVEDRGFYSAIGGFPDHYQVKVRKEAVRSLDGSAENQRPNPPQLPDLTVRSNVAVRRPVEIFFSYAHEDEQLMDDVRRQLIVHERNGKILKWHDRVIPPGSSWRSEIDYRLRHAHILLMFLSPHFIESRYCFEVESEAALQRHTKGEAVVIPIVLRPCAWQHTPYADLQALPRDARPVSRWEDRDEACLDVANGVMTVVDQLARP